MTPEELQVFRDVVNTDPYHQQFTPLLHEIDMLNRRIVDLKLAFEGAMQLRTTDRERAVIDAAVAWRDACDTEAAQAVADEWAKHVSNTVPEYLAACDALWTAVRSLREVTP